MTKTVESLHLTFSRWPAERLSEVFIYTAGAVLLFTGLAAIIGSGGCSQALSLQDQTFGIPIQMLMLTFGVTNVFVALLCLFGQRGKLTLGLLGWMGANCLIYRIELWSMGSHRSFGFPVLPLDFSFGDTDLLFSSCAIFLFSGTLALFVAQRVRTARLAWLQKPPTAHKMACPSCGGHIKFAVENLGRKIDCPHCRASVSLRRAGELLKMACFFCQGHIEFPSHALGTKIACPHCRKDITLMERIGTG